MCNKRIILHIGPPKTGTSALQYFFVRNKKILENVGIGYFVPKHDYNQWHNHSNAAFLMRETLKGREPQEDRKGIWSAEDLQEDIEEFCCYCKKYHTLILSDEILWNAGIDYTDFWLRFRNIIRALCGESMIIDIVTYLRRQDERCVSAWKERVRGTYREKDDFCSMIERLVQEGYLDYERALSNLEDCFGRKHLLVRSYNEVANKRSGIMHDFLQCTQIGDIDGITINEAMIYPSFSLTLTEAIRLINKGVVKCNADFNAIVKSAFILEETGKARTSEYPLNRRNRQKILERYRESNCRVAERYFGRDELFSDEMGEYEVWKPNPERDINNAKALARIAEHFADGSKTFKK